MPGGVGIRLAELGEDPHGCGGVEECDQPAGGSLARTAVQCLEAQTGVFVESHLHVVHPVGDVVETVAAAVEEARDLGVGAGGSEQFDAGLADLEHDRFDAVRFDRLTMARSPPQQPLVRLHGRLDVADGDAHVVDPAQHRAEYGTPVRHGAHGPVAGRR